MFPDYVAVYVHDVQLLVDAGANPHLADNNGRTACYYNRMHGYIISSECTGCSSDDDCDECCGGCTGNCNDVVEWNFLTIIWIFQPGLLDINT